MHQYLENLHKRHMQSLQKKKEKKEKKMQKWGSHEAPPKQHCKEYYGISHFGQLRGTMG